MKVGNAEILRFLNGDSPPNEKAEVEAWLSEGNLNAKEMTLMQKSWSELESLGDFKMPYVDTAWQAVKSQVLSTNLENVQVVKSDAQSAAVDHTIVKQTTVIPTSATVTPLTDIKASRPAYTKSSLSVKKVDTDPDMGWLYGLMGLILITLLSWALIQFTQAGNNFKEISTNDREEIIALDDGSSVNLQPFSLLKYPKNMESQPQRRVHLDGSAKFDVYDSPRPFIVEYGEVSVQTLATIFDVRKDTDGTVAECVEGRIRFFETENVQNGVEIGQGQIFKYVNGTFEDITPVDELESVAEEAGETIRLDALLDLLMEKSDWRVISSPSMPFDPSYEVVLDLSQDYVALMQSLGSQSDFVYKQVSCNGCYVIKKMTAPKQ